MDITKFVAAAVQASPVIFDKKATVEKAVELIDEAGKQGAKLIVFPETFISMYPNWSIDLQRPTDWPDFFVELVNSSIEIPGPEVTQLCLAAKRANAYIAIGVNEQSGLYPGRLFNTILYISASGEIMGIHRKIFPTNREKLFHTMGDGSTLDVYQTEIGRIGGLICYEHMQPLLKYSNYSRGEQIHCAVWPGWPDHKAQGGRTNKHVIDISNRSYALEGQVFVIAASMYVPKEAIPEHMQHENWSFFGGSSIVAPDGEYIVEPVYDCETIIYGEIDLNRILVRKAVMDSTGKDSRWDILNLNIRDNPDVAINDGYFKNPRPDKVFPYGYSNVIKTEICNEDKIDGDEI